MSFTINKTASVTNLSKRLKEAPHLITQQIQKIINESVLEIESKARARAPLGQVNGGKLKASIYSTPYTMNAGAKVGSSIYYSPFVEFGTGPGPADHFYIPAYKNLNKAKLEGYAQTFKRNNGNVVNLPHRPFLFNSASEELYKMVNKIKKIKI